MKPVGCLSEAPLPGEPKISCLCVTRDRVDLLRRAVGCFRRQTYTNRELVIVHESDDAPTVQYVQRIESPEIRAVAAPEYPKPPLGALRNLAIDASTGHYVAQWDDDDWYSPERLTTQLQALLHFRKRACVLGRWLIYDMPTAMAYVSSVRPWEGSVLADKSILPRYPALPSGEDTPVIDQLKAAGELVIIDRPDLYTYVYHGDNTFNRRHWQVLFAMAQPLSVSQTYEVMTHLHESDSL